MFLCCRGGKHKPLAHALQSANALEKEGSAMVSTFRTQRCSGGLLRVVLVVTVVLAVAQPARSLAATSDSTAQSAYSVILKLYQPTHVAALELEALLSTASEPFHSFTPPYTKEEPPSVLKHLYFAAEKRSGTLFLRGSPAAVRMGEELIRALDVPPGELSEHEFDGLRIVPIR
jgi:hypothetical protein